jgi:hypothetical protein
VELNNQLHDEALCFVHRVTGRSLLLFADTADGQRYVDHIIAALSPDIIVLGVHGNVHCSVGQTCPIALMGFTLGALAAVVVALLLIRCFGSNSPREAGCAPPSTVEPFSSAGKRSFRWPPVSWFNPQPATSRKPPAVR